MRLTDAEKMMLAGDLGEPRRLAIEQQLKVGQFFDAEDFVEVRQAHIMADTEALGEAGVEWLESLASHPEDQCRVKVPTLTDPRGADFATYERIRQDPSFVELERRAVRALRALGVLMTDTCIPYQTVMAPVRGEHLAYGDTGVVIYVNSVLGARSNYEGGPAAVSAALTGRTPRYGFHLDQHRRGAIRFVIEDQLREFDDWGALGGVIGRQMGSYWEVPVIEGVDDPPGSDQLKHFGAALASFGSTAMFHMVGVTPEAPDLVSVFDGGPPEPLVISRADIESFQAGYRLPDDRVDVVVFAAPQLSLMELSALADLLDGRRVHSEITLLAATSPENKAAADRMGLSQTIEDAGGILLSGVCFYQMHARQLAEANGWIRLMTNSAKLVNIIGGYGYEPLLASMEACVERACRGKVVR